MAKQCHNYYGNFALMDRLLALMDRRPALMTVRKLESPWAFHGAGSHAIRPRQ